MGEQIGRRRTSRRAASASSTATRTALSSAARSAKRHASLVSAAASRAARNRASLRMVSNRPALPRLLLGGDLKLTRELEDVQRPRIAVLVGREGEARAATVGEDLVDLALVGRHPLVRRLAVGGGRARGRDMSRRRVTVAGLSDRGASDDQADDDACERADHGANARGFALIAWSSARRRRPARRFRARAGPPPRAAARGTARAPCRRTRCADVQALLPGSALEFGGKVLEQYLEQLRGRGCASAKPPRWRPTSRGGPRDEREAPSVAPVVGALAGVVVSLIITGPAVANPATAPAAGTYPSPGRGHLRQPDAAPADGGLPARDRPGPRRRSRRGLAFAADQNGYPGPLHVLELTRELRSPPSRRRGCAACSSTMLRRRGAGRRLAAAETRLARLFAERAADERERSRRHHGGGGADASGRPSARPSADARRPHRGAAAEVPRAPLGSDRDPMTSTDRADRTADRAGRQGAPGHLGGPAQRDAGHGVATVLPADQGHHGDVHPEPRPHVSGHDGLREPRGRRRDLDQLDRQVDGGRQRPARGAADHARPGHQHPATPATASASSAS